MKRSILFLAAMGLLAALGHAAPVAEPPPAIADVRQQFTDAKYSDVVKNVSKITTSRDWQMKKADAYELFTMKGEAHLHLKESALASSSFESAAKAAAEQLALDKAAADKDAAKAAAEKMSPEDALQARVAADRASMGVAHATAYLIKHSTGTNYVPKATANQRVAGGSPEDHVKFDIVNPESRKQALMAIWTDEKNAMSAKVTAATDMDNKSPAAVMDAAAGIPIVRDFDFAANGNDDDTKKTATAIAEHARDVLQAMLDKSILRLDIIASDANSVETSRAGLPGGGYADRWHKHGLEGKQAVELKDMVANTAKVATALQMLQDQLTPDPGFFDKPLKDTKRIKMDAEKLIKIDPNESYVTREAAMKS